MLAPFTEAKDRDEAFLDLAVRSLELYDAFLAGVVESSHLPVGYKRTGTIDVAMTSARMASLRDIGERLQARGIPLSLLNADDARGQEPQLGDTVAGALLIPAHGYVNAGEMTRALVAAARCYDAHLIEARVLAVSHRDGILVVETGRGALSADVVVIAAGSWSGRINVAGSASLPVRPVRGQLLHLAWAGTPLQRVTWGEHCYLVPWDDGTLLVGATMEEVGFDERTTVSGVRQLLSAACDLVPIVSNAALVSARAGLRPGTPDAIPVIGWSNSMPNLMYATGHFRNGVLLSPLTARLVAAAVLDGVIDPAFRVTSPQRFGDL
jgi:glycine oxidase